MTSWLTLYTHVVRVLGYGHKGSLEENGTYGTLGVLGGLFVEEFGNFSDEGGIGIVDCGGRDGLCVWVEI